MANQFPIHLTTNSNDFQNAIPFSGEWWLIIHEILLFTKSFSIFFHIAVPFCYQNEWFTIYMQTLHKIESTTTYTITQSNQDSGSCNSFPLTLTENEYGFFIFIVEMSQEICIDNLVQHLIYIYS